MGADVSAAWVTETERERYEVVGTEGGEATTLGIGATMVEVRSG